MHLLSNMAITRLSEQIEQALNAQFNSAQDTRKQFPGATVSVALADGSIFSHACGFADSELHIPMANNARMPAGSIGKTFVAAVVLSMVADGILKLDTPIAQWFAGVDWFQRLPNHSVITLRHLLNHSSGIIDHVFDTASQFSNYIKHKLSSVNKDLPFSPEDLVQFVLDRKPLFAPGEGFHYSDTGYIIIGIIIEKASSHTYYDQLSERILKPLQLSDTLALDRRDLPGLVPGYAGLSRRLFGIPKKVIAEGKLVFHPSLEWTGGGIVSTTAELARWAKLLFEAKAIAPNSLHEMLTAQAKPAQQADKLGRLFNYGLGIYIMPSEFGTCYRHHGFFPGYNSLLVYFPDNKIAIAMQINSDSSDIETYFNIITAITFKALNYL